MSNFGIENEDLLSQQQKQFLLSRLTSRGMEWHGAITKDQSVHSGNDIELTQIF